MQLKNLQPKGQGSLSKARVEITSQNTMNIVSMQSKRLTPNGRETCNTTNEGLTNKKPGQCNTVIEELSKQRSSTV